MRLSLFVSVFMFLALVTYANLANAMSSMEKEEVVTESVVAKDTAENNSDTAQSLLADAPLPADYYLGKIDAPVTLVEYASFSCPHCAAFHSDVYPTLKEEYIDKGKLLYILRPFPLNEPALKASMLVDCVGEKEGAERYYTFAKVLFNAQKKWAFDHQFLDSLKTFAKVGGVDGETFDACVNDNAREIKLLKVKLDAN